MDQNFNDAEENVNDAEEDVNDAEEDVNDAEEDVKAYVAYKIGSATRIITVIILDSVIFLVWMLLSLVAFIVSEWVVDFGVDPMFATIFFWFSSVGTLVLAVHRIINDIWRELITSKW